MSALPSELALLLAQRWGMTGGSLVGRHVSTQTRAVFHLRFAAGLFYALRFMFFHDRAARWSRIVYAVEHEQELLDAISLLPPQVL